MDMPKSHVSNRRRRGQGAGRVLPYIFDCREMEAYRTGGLVIFLVETLPRLQSAQVSILSLGNTVLISPHSISTCNLDLNVPHPNPLHVHSNSTDLSHLDLSSLSSPKIVNGVLNLRFRLRADSGWIIPPADSLDSDTLVAPCLSISCSFCGLQFTMDGGAFRRVLPLPSDLWGEFGGSVFCHCHHHRQKQQEEEEEVKLEERGVASTSSTHLAPRDGDCLTSNDRLLVTAQSLNWQRIEQDPLSNSIHCKRCRQHLGGPLSVKGEVSASRPYSLQRSSVCTSTSGMLGGLPLSLLELEAHLAYQLHSFSQSEMQSKFVIKDSEKRYLRVWMLNVLCKTNIMISASKGHSKFSGDQCRLRRSSSALKVLFKFIEETDDLKDEEHDGPSLQLSHEHCLRLCLFLADSNISLPPAQRKATGYLIGFLLY